MIIKNEIIFFLFNLFGININFKFQNIFQKQYINT